MNMDHKMEFDVLGIATVLKRYRLSVPPNQREYAWTEDQVTDLLQDLQAAMRSNKDAYFLGTIVMKTTGLDAREIADGQQRLATTTMILAIMRDWFESNDDKLMVEAINNEDLSKIDTDAGERVSRLTLNTDDNEFFKNLVLSPQNERSGVRATRRSHRLISNAANQIRQHFESIERQVGKANFRDVLKDWRKYLENSATVVVLSVSNSTNAFVMFETLNDRGLKTSQADLVKNYLFEQAGDRLVEAQAFWSAMRGAVETVGEDDLVMEYLRLACCVQCGATRERDVMDRVLSLAKNKTEAIRLLNLLGEMANDYAAILNPQHPKWNEYGGDVRKAITTILYLGVTQIRPLMLAVARHFQPSHGTKAFRLMVAWSVRFLIVGGRGGKLDEGYARLANEIHKGTIKTCKELQEKAAAFVPTDGQFRGSFETARVSVNKLARYYLRALEMTARDEPNPEWIPNDDLVINLEHVMPEVHSPEWSSNASQQDVETHAKRVGNMVLLQAGKNAELGNKAFAEKRKVYHESTFLLTQQVGGELLWDVGRIETRQKQLAELAIRTWPLD
jgi:hypothetical protein